MGNKTLLDTDYDLQISWPDSTLSYTLEVFGTDTIGCKSEIGYLNVSVKACHRIFVPNSFTPNGDSYNDAFKIAGSAVYDLDFKIYNRFGDNIWSITSINEYWNGNDGNGYYCPTGIYNWVAKYSDDEGFKHVEKGHILLIR
jgi:gliding motility-associated-like protein